MDAKTRAWQRLQAELKCPEPTTKEQPAPVVDPKKETLLQRFRRVAKQPLAKAEPTPEAA
jgi:hypothetical protein